jgi:hypothetical protein
MPELPGLDKQIYRSATFSGVNPSPNGATDNTVFINTNSANFKSTDGGATTALSATFRAAKRYRFHCYRQFLLVRFIFRRYLQERQLYSGRVLGRRDCHRHYPRLSVLPPCYHGNTGVYKQRRYLHKQGALVSPPFRATFDVARTFMLLPTELLEWTVGTSLPGVHVRCRLGR